MLTIYLSISKYLLLISIVYSDIEMVGQSSPSEHFNYGPHLTRCAISDNTQFTLCQLEAMDEFNLMEENISIIEKCLITGTIIPINLGLYINRYINIGLRGIKYHEKATSCLAITMTNI